MSNHHEISPNDLRIGHDRSTVGIHPTAEASTPPVKHAISLIDAHLKGMEHDLDRMKGDLGPILGEQFPRPTGEMSADRQGSSEMYGILMDIVDRLGRHRTEVDDILNRVEF